MDHNPYTPPSAPIERNDVTSAPSPPQVKAAVWLIWISLAISSLGYALGPTDPELEGAFEESMMVLVVSILASLTLVAMILLSVFILRAHRWARIVYSVLVVLNLIGTISELPGFFALAWYHGVLFLLTVAIDVASVVLLFTPAANAWFQNRREAAQA